MCAGWRVKEDWGGREMREKELLGWGSPNVDTAWRPDLAAALLLETPKWAWQDLPLPVFNAAAWACSVLCLVLTAVNFETKESIFLGCPFPVHLFPQVLV